MARGGGGGKISFLAYSFIDDVHCLLLGTSRLPHTIRRGSMLSILASIIVRIILAASPVPPPLLVQLSNNLSFQFIVGAGFGLLAWIHQILFCRPRGDWEDPSIVGRNRLASHTPLGYFSSAAELQESKCKSPFVGSNIISLNGDWDFALGTDASFDSFTKKDYKPVTIGDDGPLWSKLVVPSNWVNLNFFVSSHFCQ